MCKWKWDMWQSLPELLLTTRINQTICYMLFTSTGKDDIAYKWSLLISSDSSVLVVETEVQIHTAATMLQSPHGNIQQTSCGHHTTRTTWRPKHHSLWWSPPSFTSWDSHTSHHAWYNDVPTARQIVCTHVTIICTYLGRRTLGTRYNQWSEQDITHKFIGCWDAHVNTSPLLCILHRLRRSLPWYLCCAASRLL